MSQIGRAPKERMIKILLSESCIREGAHINKAPPSFVLYKNLELDFGGNFH